MCPKLGGDRLPCYTQAVSFQGDVLNYFANLPSVIMQVSFFLQGSELLEVMDYVKFCISSSQQGVDIQ